MLAGAIQPRVESPRQRLEQTQHHLTAREIAEIGAQYGTGASTYKLAERWGINRDTVTLALKKAGVEVRERGQLTPLQLQEARRLQAEGWSLNRLGRRFGLDPKTMKKRLLGSQFQP